MESVETIDYPPANSLKQNDERNYPIIRCEECYEIPSINFKMDKNEIQIKCEKEGKTKELKFEEFFSTINKYEDINCCQFCKNKNPSQKYYLCKTCNNKILCQNCFAVHDKKDEVFLFKIDSTCKKHYNQYETYCPKCKESKCSYCSIEHDESHENDEILLKKKLFRKNILDEFKSRIKRIENERDNVEQNVNLVIKELEEKIKALNDLKKQFLEKLNKKLKFTQLILQNYEKKIEDFDINYFIINNLENQIKFNLLELNLNQNDSLEQKIENISNYLNKNINSQFDLDIKEKKKEIEQFKSNLDNDAIEVENELIKNFSYEEYFDGFLDFNKYLLAFYSFSNIIFFSKNNYEKNLKLVKYIILGLAKKLMMKKC